MQKTIHNEIRELIVNVVAQIAPDFNANNIFLSIPEIEKHGDYSTNVSFLLAPGLKKSPKEIASLILSKIPTSPDLLSKTELAGNGFINFFVAKDRLYWELNQILEQKEKYACSSKNNQRLQIEFVSANPTGPLHVGHGRGAAIGDTLARLFKALGYHVDKEYYINNIGNQMLILGRSVQARYEGKEVPADGYKGEYIGEIAKRISDAGRQMSDIEQFKEYAIITILGWIKKDLEDFGVEFDNWFSEKSLYESKEIEKVLSKLNEQHHIYEQEGAKFVKTTDFGDDKDRVIFRVDGRPTYFASDIAYHENKFSRGYDLLIDIWGADHHGYVPRLNAALEALGYAKEKLKIILYQLVSLKRGKEIVAMSTRAGEFVTLRQILDEVGKDACRFFFLMRSPDSPLDFDLELAKKQSADNPVYYVQYAHARICSIFREAEKNGYQKAVISRRRREDLKLLKEQEEINLIKKLANFSKILSDCARTYDPHWLTIYLQELATVFHNYYTKHRVIIENVTLTKARLCLLESVAVILKEGLQLLGISAPSKM